MLAPLLLDSYTHELTGPIALQEVTTGHGPSGVDGIGLDRSGRLPGAKRRERLVVHIINYYQDHARFPIMNLLLLQVAIGPAQ